MAAWFANWAQETSFCAHAEDPLELFKYSNPADAIETAAERYGACTPGVPLRAAHILGFAAEKYGISKHLKDYAAVPVVIMPSGYPNRNKVGFPLRRLSEFDPNVGMLAYETLRHMPTFSEHANSDYTQAKGIILDAGIRPLRNDPGQQWGVHALLAFDRTRDKVLANDILTRRRTSYSMGAFVSNYGCSICGCETANKQQPMCEHINPRNPSFQTYTVRGQRRLAHWNTGPVKFFETSSVSTPAYVSAINPDILWGG